MSDERFDLSDDALGRQLAETLPRYTAPGHLRAAIRAAAAPRPRRLPWLAPTLAAFATVLVMLLFVVPRLPRIAPSDPVDQLVRAGVAEHTRVLSWGARLPKIIPAEIPWLAQESGIELKRAFLGDDRLTFKGAEPVYVDRRRGIAIYYRDDDGHLLTYVVLPGAEMKIPDHHRRVQADRYRPALVNDGGFSALVWKQGELACMLISDMVSENDVAHLKDYFVRVRVSTEPAPAY
ncbi:MAG: hypothetical protein HY294_04755 [Candidatus Rokubacteria bacterium]|nr:hypothetical protein [Candidatus Rokubacteria bacterium]MBI3825286.1 hypothetical protein [Candidatus Rokubacteria bacterium]